MKRSNILKTPAGFAPTHPDVVYLLGETYQKKGDLTAARKYWDQAIQLNPAHLSSLLACGESYLRQNDANGARKYLDKAVEVAPNSWRAHSLLANALLRQNSYAEAVTHAQRAVQLDKGQANSSLSDTGPGPRGRAIRMNQPSQHSKTILAGKPARGAGASRSKTHRALKRCPGRSCWSHSRWCDNFLRKHDGSQRRSGSSPDCGCAPLASSQCG